MIEFTDEDEIEAAFQHYRKAGFPYPVFTQHEIIHKFRTLQAATSKINRNKRAMLLKRPLRMTIPLQQIGDRNLADHFHPHIFETRTANMRSPMQSFNDDKYLRKAIFNALKYNHAITNQNLEIFLRTVSGTQMCSGFRATTAKAIYNYLGGDDVLDMSCGFGGRLIGFLASNCKGRYVGVDPSRPTIRGNKRIIRTFNAADRVKLICKPFEDVDASELGRVDTAFTSPPYFQKEIYTKEGDMNQSRERYTAYEDWLKNFLVPVIRKTKQVLRPSGTMAINIMDVTLKKKRLPLVQDTINIATSIGFKFTEQLDIPLPSFGKGLKKRRSEPVLIFKKKS